MYNRIRRYIANTKRKKCIIQKYSKYLLPGEYVFDTSLSYIYLKNDIKASKLLNNNYSRIILLRSGLRIILYCLTKFFFFHHVFVAGPESKKEPFFQGTLLQIAEDEKEHKIFDLENKRILLLFFDKKSYDKKIEFYNQFHKYFPMPAIQTCESKKLLIIEEFIPAIETGSWTKYNYMDVMADVLRKEKFFMEKCKQNNEYSLISPKELLQMICRKSPLTDFILSNIKINVLDENIPFLMQHGDLWSSNILVGNSPPHSIYYIDWERSGQFVFYYDIFFLLLNECFIKQNFIYAAKYMCGEYDDTLETIFHIFGIQFVPEHKIGYLYITLLNQYIERWTTSDIKEERKILRQWKTVFRKIMGLKK